MTNVGKYTIHGSYGVPTSWYVGTKGLYNTSQQWGVWSLEIRRFPSEK